MKHRLTVFLQVVIILIGIVSLAIMIRLPLIEGRAASLDLFSIYSDPFIIYGYVSSLAFFVALYKVFRLLGYIGNSEAFSLKSVRALRSIKYCAFLISILVLAAGLYIRIFHKNEDDPAGFMSISIVIAFISIVVAAVSVVLETILQNGMDLKFENEQLSGKQRINPNE